MKHIHSHPKIMVLIVILCFLIGVSIKTEDLNESSSILYGSINKQTISLNQQCTPRCNNTLNESLSYFADSISYGYCNEIKDIAPGSNSAIFKSIGGAISGAEGSVTYNFPNNNARLILEYNVPTFPTEYDYNYFYAFIRGIGANPQPEAYFISLDTRNKTIPVSNPDVITPPFTIYNGMTESNPSFTQLSTDSDLFYITINNQTDVNMTLNNVEMTHIGPPQVMHTIMKNSEVRAVAQYVTHQVTALKSLVSITYNFSGSDQAVFTWNVDNSIGKLSELDVGLSSSRYNRSIVKDGTNFTVTITSN